MAVLHGNVGSFAFYSDTGATASDIGATIATGGFTNWTLDANVDMLDTTNFAGTTWKTFMPGLATWTGTADQHWQSDLLDEFGESVIVRFYLDDTQSVGSDDVYYYGIAKVEGLSVEDPIDALIDQTLTFTGVGRLYSNQM